MPNLHWIAWFESDLKLFMYIEVFKWISMISRMIFKGFSMVIIYERWFHDLKVIDWCQWMILNDDWWLMNEEWMNDFGKGQFSHIEI